MRFVTGLVLLLVAAIHAIPLVGVVSAERVASLYGVAVNDPNLEILLRHRAVLFGLLAVFLACSAFRAALRGAGLIVAAASVVSFLLLAQLVGGYNPAIANVVRADWVALGLLVVGGATHSLERWQSRGDSLS
ncbi:MAG: phosphopantetheine adenylyltransferase [Pseudomonadota bacterium]